LAASPGFLALDFLQTVTKIQKGRVGGTFLVVSKNQTGIITHALANKAARKNMTNAQLRTTGRNKDIAGQPCCSFHLQLKVAELRKKELGCCLNVLLEQFLLLPVQLGCQQLDVPLHEGDELLLVKRGLLLLKVVTTIHQIP